MKKLALLAVVLCAVAATASAEIVIFDDAAQNGWNITYHSQLVGASVLTPYEGALSIRRAEGTTGGGPIFENSAGFALGSNGTLRFYANSPLTEQSVGFSRVMVTFMDNTTAELGVRNGGVTWFVDGVARQGHIVLDNDPATWQFVEIDLLQTYYVWSNGEQPRNIDPSALVKRIEVSTNVSGRAMAYMDMVTLVPEPATLSVLGLGALALIRRRRS